MIPDPGTSSEDEASDDFDVSAEGMEMELGCLGLRSGGWNRV
jgi:hypothetical protein